MALETMRRYLTPEDYDVQGELAPSTVEEKTAEALGVTPELARELGMPSKGPMAALDRAANLARIASIGPRMGEDETRARQGDVRVAEKIGGDMTAETVRALGLRNAGGIGIPPSMTAPPNRGFFNPTGAVGLERTGLRLNEPVEMPETVPSLSMPSGAPAKTSDFASLQKTMSPGVLASPIPVASAPVKADVPAAVAGTIAPTTPTQSAPPAGGQTEPDLSLIPTANLRAATTGDGASPAVRAEMAQRSTGVAASAPSVPASDGSGGDDELVRLSIGQALTRALEGSGSVISGQNLRSGAADTLGERMKQIEALRAKREERAADVAQEQAQYEGANLATLTTQLAAFKDRPDIVAALQNLKPGAKYTKPSDFIKSAYQAVTNPPTVAGKEATAKKTGAQTTNEEGKPEIARGTLEVKQGTLAERKRSNEANEELRRKALLAKQLSDTKANNDVRAAGKDAAAAEKAITRAMETAESDKLGIVGNIRDFQGIEVVAPGFTKGAVPDWLPQGGIAAARKVPGLEQKTAALSSALETFIAGIRKSLFGASLTGNEKESFDAIVSSGLMMPPDVLAANINRIRQGAARFAQNHFTVAQQLHPEVTGRVLGASSIFGPAISEGGIYSDVWKLPKAPAAAGKTPPPMAAVEFLKKNPDQASSFDLKYGAGSAAEYLGEVKNGR